MSGVGSRYQATAIEDVTVNGSVCVCVCVYVCVRNSKLQRVVANYVL
jgi:hypothetical protein